MKAHRIIRTLTAVAMAAALSTSCDGDRRAVGLVVINLQARFFNDLREGAQQAAREADVDLRVVDGNNDPGRQVQALENLIVQGVDAIVIVAVDPAGIKPAVWAARDAGIPTVAVDARVDVPPAHAFIGTDNRAAAAESGKYLGRLVTEERAGKANVGVIGALNSLIQNERRDGFLEAVKTVPGVNIVGVVDGQNVQEQALSAAENLVTGNPTIDYIYATGEPALIGAIAAVESQGAANRIRIIGWDLSPQAARGIREGTVQAVVQQDPRRQGAEAVRAALRLRKGEAVPPATAVPVTIVTKDNLQQFEALYER